MFQLALPFVTVPLKAADAAIFHQGWCMALDGSRRPLHPHRAMGWDVAHSAGDHL